MTHAPPFRRRTLLLAGSLPAFGTAMPGFAAEPWPSKPITLVVPFSAGGPTDTQMRAMAVAVGKALGQPVLVVNQPGAGGTLAPAQMARNAAADGYRRSSPRPCFACRICKKWATPP